MENNLTFEEFYDEVWDRVSLYCVSDEFFNKNGDLIQELTYDLYYLYSKSNDIDPLGNKIQRLTIKNVVRLVEVFFEKFKRYNKL